MDSLTPKKEQPQNGNETKKIINLSDSELASWLAKYVSSKTTIVYIYSRHLFKFYELDALSPELIIGDLGANSVRKLKTLANKNRLRRLELDYECLEELVKPDPSWKLLDATASDISRQRADRDRILGQGRGKAISASTTEKVWRDAGGRCMYRGCGRDLSHTTLTTKQAKIAYLAHIVASDPDGPRGKIDSHSLSDVPENIMLMCDEHHRLIDRVDVAGHPEDLLAEMRKDHTSRVRLLLDSLSYPSAQIITLLADIAQVPTNVSTTELYGALLARHLGPLPEIKHMLRRTQRDDRSRIGFWKHFLHEHDSDIREFISFVGNRAPKSTSKIPDTLAIFPLHLVPILVLAGRIVGEARKTEIFQYARNLQTWKWPESIHNLESNLTLQHELDRESDFDEAILSFELTSSIDKKCLPRELLDSIESKKIGWIRILSDNPNADFIKSNTDLNIFSDLARQALKEIQDSWRCKIIHVFGLSPASTLFKFGQMLQAGNHSLCRVYDRPAQSEKFIPALDITGEGVSSVGVDEPQHSINLR